MIVLSTAQLDEPAVKVQPDPLRPRSAPRYIRFDFVGNPERGLAEFLRSKGGRDLLGQILQQEWHKLLEQPPGNIRDIIAQTETNPFLREMLEKFLSEHPNVPRGDVGDLTDAVQKFALKLGESAELRDAILKGIEANPEGILELKNLLPPTDLPPSLPKVDPFLDFDSDEPLTLEDRFAEWLIDTFKDSELRDDVVEFLKESPELHEAVADMLRSLGGRVDPDWLSDLPRGPSQWNVDIAPPKLPFELGQLPQLPKLTLPRLPRVPMPRLPGFSRPRLDLPGFGRHVELPGLPDGSSLRTGLFVVVGLLLAITAAMFLRGVGSNRTGRSLAAFLAALPGSISTRTELRQAFDRLALARLGDRARPWNHRQIARHLADDSPADGVHAEAVDALAGLYEIARYTPGDDRLSAAEQDAVRRSLAALTRSET